MPHYPCRQCEALYDPVTNVACPSCGEKHPLNCSKCDKQINHHDIFGIEKLKTKKPLLCADCGFANEVVKCPICKLHLVRAKGFSPSSSPNAKVYHRPCYDKRLETITFAKKWAGPSVAALGLIGGFVAYGLSIKGLLASLGTGAVLFAAVMMLAEVIKPR